VFYDHEMVAYATSKHAAVAMVKQVAIDYGKYGVRVNALCPGWFASEMTEGMESGPGMAFIEKYGPMPRLASPSELDGPLLLLASDASSFMTGSMVVVDGGWTAH
jgi:NAD(P)-dependent dehydrogenase (short-subunit alcohol dehydrogenase family)